MSITTKLARHYNNGCEQVMPVPVMMVKLMCYRRPMPLYPPVYPPYPCQPPYPQPVYQQHVQHTYPHAHQHSYSHQHVQPAYVPEQRQAQNYQMVAYHTPESQQIPVENHVEQLLLQSEVEESIQMQSIQTQSTSNKNDSDSNYHLPPSYPIIEYSDDIIVFPGNIVITTMKHIPDGYFLCDGSCISREIDSILFEVIGTFYGSGDGSTTFCLPDLENEEQSHHYMIKR